MKAARDVALSLVDLTILAISLTGAVLVLIIDTARGQRE